MASINDPIFYASHTYFDRLAHFLALSPELERRGFNRTWPVDNSSRRRLRRLSDQHKEETEDEEMHLHHHSNRSGCIGGDYDDPSPFSHFFLTGTHEEEEGGEEGEEAEANQEQQQQQQRGDDAFYSMREIDAMVHPRHPGLPYVYDELMVWGGRRWVPKGKAVEDEEEEAGAEEEQDSAEGN
jgi:hypothetical protein